MAENYELRRFKATERDSVDYALGVNWIHAVCSAFHDPRPSEEHVDKIMSMFRKDEHELTGVYRSGPARAHSLGNEIPIATFGTFRKDLNTGYGRQLQAHLITDVTVRGTHRRQGLLRQMMTAELARAKADGVAIAALTATEGSIYRRFGYGVATFERTIKVDAGQRFRLPHEATGTIEVADRKVLLKVAPAVFAQAHQVTPGSIVRQEEYRQKVSGTCGLDGKEYESIRCALHYDSHGEVDGYVAYRFAGWNSKPISVDIVDLVAATNTAYLELWQFLGSIDLIQQITWDRAPVDDPLVWALEDPRSIAASYHRDLLWLRILNLRSALMGRDYSLDDALIFEVSDSLGIAAGTFRLEVSGGKARVADTGKNEFPDLSLDVSELGSIYLGAVCPLTLKSAGRIREHTPGAAFRARRMFTLERAAHCLTHF